MTTLTRQEILNTLQVDWAAYVQQFRFLSPCVHRNKVIDATG